MHSSKFINAIKVDQSRFDIKDILPRAPVLFQYYYLISEKSRFPLFVPYDFIMTPSNGNIFRVIGPLCEEFTGDRWIPRTKASGAELWCFLWSGPGQTVE